MTTTIFIAGLAIFLPAVANANVNVIKQRPFVYSFDVARATESDVFVVCANSPDDRISVLPAPPQLAMRLSQNEVHMEEQKNAVASVTEAGKACINCLSGTVYFPFNCADLTQTERSKLDELIRRLQDGKIVDLDGYTCDLGSSSYNTDLSLKRARGVASYLRGKGISVGKVNGHGACCPASDNRRLNRRVEITTAR